MNRNVNMTGNFGGIQGKSLKPGDSALIGMKSGPQALKMNSNTNPNKFQKYDENQLNEAKESMKLLQTKMGNNLGNTNIGGSMKSPPNNINYNNLNSNVSNNNTNTNNNNSNYRKPFKPNFENENPIIQVDSNKNFPGTSGMNRINSKNHLAGGVASSYKPPGNNRISNTSNTHRNYPDNNNNQDNKIISSQKQKNIPINNNAKFNYEEADDDRPAFTKTNVHFDRADADPYNEDDGERIPCQSCGRQFREEALYKHQKVCKKVFVNKRKSFDIKKQRLDGEAMAIFKHKEFEEKKKGKFGVNSNNNAKPKGAKWKKQSEEFRAILKAGREAPNLPTYANSNTRNKTGGGPNSNIKGNSNSRLNKGGNPNVAPMTMPTSVLYEDYIACNLCSRKYNEQAYNKHLPTCERRSKESMMKDKAKAGGTPYQPVNYNSKPNLNVKFGKK